MDISRLNGFDREKTIHAYLIVSASLLDAREYSMSLAASLVCLSPEQDGNACGECACCKKVLAGTHPDIYILGRKKVSVNEIRDLRTNAYMTANEDGRKIFVLESVDKFNESSLNAMLKILEEPPESVVFILTCASKGGVLPTVLSRVCVLTPALGDFDYYKEASQRALGENADEEKVNLLAAYLYTYDDADIESLDVKSLCHAYSLATDYLSGKKSDIVSFFPNKKEEAQEPSNTTTKAEKETARKAANANLHSGLCLYLRAFMLAAKNVVVYKATAGKGRVYPSDEGFRRMCTRISINKALSLYERLEKLYEMEINTGYTLNTSVIFAYLNQVL